MELWIRTQDKKRLIKCEDIGIETFYAEFRIHAYKDYNSYVNKVILGDYKTEERALEVLNEIQLFLGKNNGYVDTVIYQMPEE